MEQRAADEFAREWIAAWNSRDLERVLAHYRDDAVPSSPFVERVPGPGLTALHGKAALRDYWGVALPRHADLRFEPLLTLAGSDSLVLCYRSVAGPAGAECMRPAADGKVREVLAHYAADPGA